METWPRFYHKPRVERKRPFFRELSLDFPTGFAYHATRSKPFPAPEDGASELFRSNVVIGTAPAYLGETPAKAATEAALFTWTGWTNAAGAAYAPADALPAVAKGGTNYVATFKTWTKVARPTVATGLVYDGTDQTGVTLASGSAATGATAARDAGSYPVTIALVSGDSVWADATDPAEATAREIVAADWSIAKKPISLTWGATLFVWDGTPKLPTVETADFAAGDDLSVAASGAQTAAGTYTATASLSGGDAGNYALPADPTTAFEITSAAAMAISVADAGTGATTTNYFATVQAALDSAAGAEPAVESVVLLADATETVVVSNAVALVLGDKTLTGNVTNTVAATISGGTVDGDLVADGAALSVTGGSYLGSLSKNGAGSISITGGFFAEDPSDYVAQGYYAAPVSGGYEVLPRRSILETTITVADAGAYDGTGTTFAIAKAKLTVTAPDGTVRRGADAGAIRYAPAAVAYAGFVNGETVAVLAAEASFGPTNYTAAARTGATFDVVAAGAEAANYVFDYVDGTLTVVAGAIAAVDATEYDTIAEAVAAAGKTADGKVVTMLDDADAAVVLAFGDVLKIEHDDFDVQVGVSDADAARYHVTATDLKAARWDVVSGTSTLWKELGENAEIRVDSLDTTSSPVRFFRIAVTPYALSASDSVTFGKSE